MPFRRVSTNTYKSPSGRTFTKKQVALYHASDGFQNVRRNKKASKSQTTQRKS